MYKLRRTARPPPRRTAGLPLLRNLWRAALASADRSFSSAHCIPSARVRFCAQRIRFRAEDSGAPGATKPEVDAAPSSSDAPAPPPE
eukprot:NODE_10647_length_1338_cov_3.283237.p6 GENE.NODE_10647_length_1338_cov_3.283237~~NODE_10647_length_1338_cov_3.283237.p6  ORF type:complete len:87 (-),score=5.63 NODE_10647_length_1338_cov_3.283237:827-1087(-)